MSINVYTEWGNLKEIIVGDCVNIDQYNVEFSFKLFFHDNIKDQILKESISLQKRVIEQRQEDLDGLAKTLQEMGINVLRPRKLDRIASFKTPYFEDYSRPVDNPRDQVLIYGDRIIETPCIWRGRYFENDLMKDIFQKYFDRGARWTTAPRPMMKDESFDLSYVQRDVQSTIDWGYYDKLEKSYEIMFDGAQCLKFGRDIIMNVSNKNHKLGAKWLEKALGSAVKVHTVELTDHHIDGMFMPLRPGLLLFNASGMKEQTHKLPPGLQKWNHVVVPHPMGNHSGPISLASSNITVNVLPINDKKVMIFGNSLEECHPLGELLCAEGFEVVPTVLRHSRLFGGGLHCVTLDTVREDEPLSYF